MHLDIALRVHTRLILRLREVLKLLRTLVRSCCILLVLSNQQTPDNAGNEQNRDDEQGERVQTVEQNCQVEGD
ncbi:Uncharacterised protein [Mycobacterium tuberculosis]|nr:Uncharacterised protein [Mycobacterium tuberculosis]